MQQKKYTQTYKYKIAITSLTKLMDKLSEWKHLNSIKKHSVCIAILKVYIVFKMHKQEILNSISFKFPYKLNMYEQYYNKKNLKVFI